MPARAVICTGMIDRIEDASNISYKTNADSIEESMSIKTIRYIRKDCSIIDG
jgi:hypothetical protein